MPSPDVRVRLSAEGVQEVVDALKRIQAESQNTAKSVSRASEGGSRGAIVLGKALEGAGEVMAALGVTISVGSLVELTRQSVDAAESVTKLRERLGGTVENLSALSAGARLTGSDINALEASLGHFATRRQALREGDPSARADFANLHLNAGSFQGQDLTASLVTYARALRSVSDEGTKAAFVERDLGKTGRELVPLVKELGEPGGLEALKQKASALGLLLDARTVESAKRLGDNMKLISDQATNVGMHFAAGLGDASDQTLHELAQNIGRDAEALEALGRVAARAIGLIYGVAKAAVAPWSALLARITIGLTATWEQATLAMRGHFAEAAARGRLYEQQIREIEARSRADIASGLKLAFGPSATPSPSATSSEGGGGKTAEELFRERERALKSALANEKAIHDAQLALRERNEESSYRRSLTTIRDHYAARRKLAEEQTRFEIAQLVRQRVVAAANPIGEDAVRDVKAIDAQIRVLKIKSLAQQADLNDAEIADVRRLGDTRLSYERKVLEAQGNRYAATLLDIAQERRDLTETLRLQGLSTAEIRSRVAAFDDAMTAAANFEAARNEADNVMARFTSKRARIQADVQAGQLTQLQGENAILALERQRLPGLREMADALTRAAAATNNPDAILQAEQFSDGLRNMGQAADVAEQGMQHLRAKVADVFQGTLAEYFSDGINQAKSFGDAMDQLALRTVNALQRIAAEQLALELSSHFFGGNKKSSGGDGLAGILSVLGKAFTGFAGGGLVSGAGTATSDSNLIAASNGEFVVRAPIVAQPGVLASLEALNLGRQPFQVAALPGASSLPADLLEGLSGARASAGSGPFSGQLTLKLGPGLVLGEMDTPAGHDFVLKVVGKNPRKIRGMLGN